MPQRFYIAGCQRSGTTLLRLVLDSHPDIRCLDEAMAYDFLSGRSDAAIEGASDAQQASDGKASGFKAIGFKIPRFAEQLTWPEIIDPDYGCLAAFYRGEKTLFIVRDPCDVVASMLSLKSDASRNWLERHALQVLHCTMPACSGNALFKEKLSRLEQGELPLHLIGALYWELKNQGLLALSRGGFPVCPLRYEALVSEPRLQLEAITQFLGVPWSDALLMHHRIAHDGLDAAGMAIGNTDPGRAIDTASIGHGKLLLGDAQRHEIRAFVADTCVSLADAGLVHDL